MYKYNIIYYYNTVLRRLFSASTDTRRLCRLDFEPCALPVDCAYGNNGIQYNSTVTALCTSRYTVRGN